MSYKISIILPIFNMEKYLKNALDSILNQTFGAENLEVIMVDDASTDNSKDIINDYASRYENFKAVFLNKNSGAPGKPRNAGLDCASAEYIMFLDPDDELMGDVCEVLYEKIMATDADIVTGNAVRIKPDEEVLDLNYRESYYEISPNRNLKLFKPFRVWGSIFKKSMIGSKIRFIDTSTNEDTYFIYSCFFNAHKIVYVNDYIGVKYYSRDSNEIVSQTNNYSKRHIVETIEAFRQILMLIYESDPTEDYQSDPFIGNIYFRFTHKWQMDFEDKKEIFLKILEYENVSRYVVNLNLQFKVMDFLLNRKMFRLLSLVQVLYNRLCYSRFAKKYLLPKSGEGFVD